MTTPRQVAIEFFNQSITATKNGDPNLGYRLLGSSVQIDPNFTMGWFQVGNANADTKNLPAAVAAFRRALEIGPTPKQPGDMDPATWARVMVNIGHRLYHMGRLKEAREWTLKALETDFDPSYAWCNLSLIQSVEGELDESLESAKKAYALCKEAQIETGLAFAHLYKGDYAQGLKHFHARFGYRMPQYLSFPYPRWKGQNVKDKTLYVIAEQGMGDTLSCFRFIPEVCSKVGNVILNVQQELMRVAQMSLGSLRNLQIGPIPAPFPKADLWCSMTSLPHALGLTTEQIRDYPDLQVGWSGLPADRPQWKSPERKLHVGVAWGGSADNDIDVHRSFDMRHLLELYAVPGIQLYSIQKGPRAQDIHTYAAATLIRDLNPWINDALDTMEIMRNLDLVITVESSPLHMANFVGAEVWVPYSYMGRDWRCGHDGSSMIWSPRGRAFKQDADQVWPPVFEKIAAALRERMGPT